MVERRPLATIAEVSAYLRVPVTTIYDWRHRGVAPKAHRVGRSLRFDWADVEAWLEARAQTEKSAA